VVAGFGSGVGVKQIFLDLREKVGGEGGKRQVQVEGVKISKNMGKKRG
jgi:hypothetical protein